jgi:DnaJ-class molecular chaperone
MCETCQGNGEIVTDWERYLHPHHGDVGDEAVADCPDCDGTGKRDAADNQ